MMLAASLLIACNNIDGASFFGGGTRAATGEMPVPEVDSGGGDTGGGDTGASESDAPLVTDITGAFQTVESENADYLVVTLQYTDAQGDVQGGKIFFDVIDNGGSPSTESRSIVAIEEVTSITSYAGDDGATLTFGYGPVDTSHTYVLDAIVVKDTAGHESEPAAFEIAASSDR
jgi:hypothetical protein